jgi:predicted transcriptional regulator
MKEIPSEPHLASGAESCADLIKCMYALSDLDQEVLKHLLEEGSQRAEDLADALKRDRSTVYRSLQKLVACQIVTKESKSLERGGYFHVYAAVHKDLLKVRLEHCVEDWHSRMQELLSRFDEDFESL